MASVEQALSGVTKVGLDTAPIIYFIESHPDYDRHVAPVFELIANGALTAVTSVVSLIEVLIQPLRQGNLALYRQYRELLTESDNLDVVAVDSAIAEQAAALRATHDLKVPDAVQLAAALQHGCDAFLTNDRRLSQVPDMRVIVIGDHVQ